MDADHTHDLEQLITRLEGNDPAGAAAHLEVMRTQDIAAAVAGLDADTRGALFDRLPAERQVAVFAELDHDQQVDLLDRQAPDHARYLLSAMPPDDLTGLLEDLPVAEVRRLLRLLPFRSIRRALTLLGYPEESCGRLMTTTVVTVRPDWTMGRALDEVRAQAEQGQTANLVYVTDEEGVLQGVLPLKYFLRQEADRRVAERMNTALVTIDANEPQEEGLRVIRDYDVAALPVVNEDRELLGIITVDDVLDVEEEETTEDFQRMASLGPLNLNLRSASPALLYRKRVGWLLVLIALNLVGGIIISGFEDAIEAVVVLVFFLPLIIDGGGNAGTQSATLMIRSLATGDLRPGDWIKLWGKELLVAGALGLTMGIAVSALGLWRGGADVAMLIALAMFIVVMMGSLLGMLLPFILSRLNLDPATASAPLVTSIADVVGITIYFSLAMIILGIQ